MLIDLSYFNGDLYIPNTDQDSVVQNISWFINKYEPEFLQKLFGYAFYKAFIAAISTTPPALPDARWQNLIYGAEYTSLSTARLEKWKGLLITTIPVYSFGTGFMYKEPLWIQAGVTAGFTAGINTATFTDWIGWTPVIDRVGSNGIMQAGVDYSFDSDITSDTAGLLTLLKAGDLFQPQERFYVSFQLQPVNQQAIDSTIKQSLIADYVYYWLQRNAETNTTGIGETKTLPAGSIQVSAGVKAARAWNEIAQWVYELYDFMQSSAAIYPEYDYYAANALSYATYYYFKKINTFF